MRMQHDMLLLLLLLERSTDHPAMAAFFTPTDDACTMKVCVLCPGCYLPAPRERVHTIHSWLLKHLVRHTQDPSMRSSMHATLSDAMASFEQCKCASPQLFCAFSSARQCCVSCYRSACLLRLLLLDKHRDCRINSVLMCRKLTETQFPFFWYQAMTILLILLTVVFPFVTFSFVDHPAVSIVICAITVQVRLFHIKVYIRQP